MGHAVKLSDELVESARFESEIFSRSMAQQIEHWARIGRAVERTASLAGNVRAALKAELEYDALSTEEKLSYLSHLERDLHMPNGDKDFARELAEAE